MIIVPKDFATPREATAVFARLLADWHRRAPAERHDAGIVAGRIRDVADIIGWWERYRETYGDRPTQWSQDAAKGLAGLAERVYATAPLPQPAPAAGCPSDPRSFRSRFDTWERHLKRESKPLPISAGVQADAKKESA